MQTRRLFVQALVLVTLLPFAAVGADILAEVPSDALGFVVVHDLATLEGKIERLSSVTGRNLPRPLTFLKAMAGVSEGVDSNGDFLLAFFPDAGDGQIQFCVWLPIRDYDQFLKSVRGTESRPIAAATLAGENVIIARHNDWALIMDPEQRTRLADLASSTPSSTVIANWKDWIASNDVTGVAFSTGLHQFSDWLSGDDPEHADENPFGSLNNPRHQRGFQLVAFNGSPKEILQSTRQQFQEWLAAAPEMAAALQQVPVAACGIRVDKDNNAAFSFRAAMDRDLAGELADSTPTRHQELPFSGYAGGGFAMQAAGHVSRSLLSAVGTTYLRRTVADLKAEERTELRADALKQMEEAIEQAAAEVNGVHLLSQPGEKPQPVYTNEFATLRVTSAKKFVDHAGEVMRLWNTANRDAKGGTRLVFDVEETKIGQHAAQHYSLDVAALDGGVALPEIRQAMERLFGPGGKLQAWVVTVDDNTVLVAIATPDQVTALANVLDKKQPIEWKSPDFAQTNALLPAEASGRMFVDLHRYVDWQNRETAAMNSTPIIGAKPTVDFPTSPPVGVAFGIRASEAWCDVVAPVDTLAAASRFYEQKQRSPVPRLRSRVVAPRPAIAPMPR